MSLNPEKVQDLRRLVIRLELVSHAGATRLDSQAPSSEQDIGGNRPPGGVSYRDDRQDGFALKSAAYFVRRFASTRSDSRLVELIGEAERAVRAWERTPIPAGQEPEVSSPQWKRFVAESSEPDGRIATRFGVSRQYIRQIRDGWR